MLYHGGGRLGVLGEIYLKISVTGTYIIVPPTCRSLRLTVPMNFCRIYSSRKPAGSHSKHLYLQLFTIEHEDGVDSDELFA